MAVTVIVRSVPWLTFRYGTRVAWRAGKRDVLLALPALPSSAESGAKGGEVAVERRVRTRLEDDIPFGVKDESAHIGDDRAATGQEHAEEQADVGLGTLDQIVKGLSVLDLPQGDPVGGNRPFNVAVDLDADGVAGGVVQDLDGCMPLTSKRTSKPQAALAPSSMNVSSWGIRKVSGGVASAAVGASTARATARPRTMSWRIGRPRSRLDIAASPVTAQRIAVWPGWFPPVLT
jgi:hypothetical protein